MKSTIKIDYERGKSHTPVIKIIIPDWEKTPNENPGDLEDDDPRDGLVRDLLHPPCMAAPSGFFEIKTTFPVGNSTLTTIGAIEEENLLRRFKTAILSRYIPYSSIVKSNDILRSDGFNSNIDPVPVHYDRYLKIHSFFDWLNQTERPEWEKQQYGDDEPEMIYPPQKKAKMRKDVRYRLEILPPDARMAAFDLVGELNMSGVLDFEAVSTKEAFVIILGDRMPLKNTKDGEKYWITVINAADEEYNLLQRFDDMCAESLDPDTHNKWDDVKAMLIRNRKHL